MHWIIIALIAPFLWAIVNHTDKYLLSKYLKFDGPGALIIFSSLAGCIALPVALFFYPEVLNISIKDALFLLLAGTTSAFAVFFYFKALYQDETTNVIPLFQTIPIFGFFLGYFILNEHVSINQILGSLIIIIGAIFLSVRQTSSGDGLSVRNKSTFFILISSFLYASYEVLFKFIAINDNFWLSIFWQNIGLFIVGLGFIVFIKKFRDDFIALYRTNGNILLGINLLNEILTLTGNIIFSYATLLAPIALVMTVNGYQPIFVLIIGIGITYVFPTFSMENLSKNELKRKIISITLITIGSLIAYF